MGGTAPASSRGNFGSGGCVQQKKRRCRSGRVLAGMETGKELVAARARDGALTVAQRPLPKVVPIWSVRRP